MSKGFVAQPALSDKNFRSWPKADMPMRGSARHRINQLACARPALTQCQCQISCSLFAGMLITLPVLPILLGALIERHRSAARSAIP